MTSCSFPEPCFKNEVVVVDDSIVTQNAAKEVVQDELDWSIHVVSSKKDAVELSEPEQAALYIVDIDLGEGRLREGIDTLEELKDINQNNLVAILSNHESEEIKRQIISLEADVYQPKTDNQQEDIRLILYKMLIKAKSKVIDKLQSDALKVINGEIEKSEVTAEVIKYINFIDERLENIKQHIPQDRVVDIDFIDLKPEWKVRSNNIAYQTRVFAINNSDVNVNIDAFERLKSDDAWFKENEGYYVAFVDGKLVGKDKDKENFLNWLELSEEFKDKPRFFIKVEENQKVIDLSSALWWK